MREAELENALRLAAEEVLEKMFFVQPLEEHSGGADDSGTVLSAELTFEGAPSGSLTLAVSESAARQIAADFLGEDEGGVSDRKVQEVVCELANMICGSVLSRVESETTFRLAAPRLLASDERRLLPESADESAVFTLELANGSLTATVVTRNLLCPTDEKSAF